MQRIPQDFINDLIAKSSIVDYIGRYVQLKQFGPSFKAACPFHNEKTPSFSVSSTKQVYHCFGCGVSGNIITFIMQFNNIDFVEAVTQLANELNVELPTVNEEQSDLNKKIFASKDIYTKINQLYVTALSQNEVAKKYINDRGISSSSRKKYNIGYSPDVWDFITSKFKKDLNMLLETGMIVKNNNKLYDRFRGRLMFPILNDRGNCIGFGARTLTDAIPKYLNSSDSFLFKKGSELYGLYEIISKKKNINHIIVVEGYMDVIALSNFQISNAVASLGTAVTKNQIQKILKYTDKITFCFDGDKAGRAAAWKALLNTIPFMHKGIFVKFVFLPEGEDPDSYVNKVGKDGIAKYFRSGQDLTDYMFSHLSSLHLRDDISSKTNFINACNDVIKTIPKSIFRSLLEEKLNTMTGINTTETVINNKPLTATIKHKPKSFNNMNKLLAILIQNPKIYPSIKDKIQTIKNILQANNVANDIISYLDQVQPDISPANIIEYFRSHDQSSTIHTLMNYDVVIPETGSIDECYYLISSIEKSFIQDNINELVAKSKLGKLSDSERQLLQDLLLQQKS